MLEYLYIMTQAKMQQYFGNERGQGITEYAAILAIVVAIAVYLNGSDFNLKAKIGNLYNNVATNIGKL